MKNQVQKHVSYSPSEEWSYLLLRINLTKCPTHIFTSNAHSPISPEKMVLSTQGQKNFTAQILLGFYCRHSGGNTVFKRVTLGKFVTKIQDYRIKNHVGANI